MNALRCVASVVLIPILPLANSASPASCTDWIGTAAHGRIRGVLRAHEDIVAADGENFVRPAGDGRDGLPDQFLR